jgi:hypothetical protein
MVCNWPEMGAYGPRIQFADGRSVIPGKIFPEDWAVFGQQSAGGR